MFFVGVDAPPPLWVQSHTCDPPHPWQPSLGESVVPKLGGIIGDLLSPPGHSSKVVGFRAVYPPLDLIVSCDGFTSDERNDVVDEELLDCVELSRALPTIPTASVCSHLAYR